MGKTENIKMAVRDGHQNLKNITCSLHINKIVRHSGTKKT